MCAHVIDHWHAECKLQWLYRTTMHVRTVFALVDQQCKLQRVMIMTSCMGTIGVQDASTTYNLCKGMTRFVVVPIHKLHYFAAFHTPVVPVQLVVTLSNWHCWCFSSKFYQLAQSICTCLVCACLCQLRMLTYLLLWTQLHYNNLMASPMLGFQWLAKTIMGKGRMHP